MDMFMGVALALFLILAMLVVGVMNVWRFLGRIAVRLPIAGMVLGWCLFGATRPARAQVIDMLTAGWSFDPVSAVFGALGTLVIVALVVFFVVLCANRRPVDWL